MYSRSVVIIVTLILLPEMTFAWGNRESHPRLVDQGSDRSKREGGSIDAYLQDELGLAAGLDEALAIQLGFKQAEIEADLVNKSDESRLERSFNRVFFSNGFPVFLLLREHVSENATIEVNRGRCSELSSCKRFSVLHLLRNGTFAEDNPNIRSRHHFHDPAKEHEPPPHNRGLDNKAEGRRYGPLDDWFLNVARGGGDFDFTGLSARDRALSREGADTPESRRKRISSRFRMPGDTFTDL